MGKSSSVTIGSKYLMTLHMGLCSAVDSIKRITAGGKTVFEGDLSASGDVQINKPELFGGDQKEGGIVGTLSVMMGEADQPPHPLLVQLLGEPMPAFRGLVTVLFDGEVSSMTAYVKPWSFQAQRFVKGWRTAVWEPALCTVDQGMNGAHYLYRAVTDPVTGLGRDPSALDLDKLKAVAQTLKNEGFGLCLKWSRSDVLNNFIGMVTNHIGALWVDDPTTGKQYPVLLRGDYDVATLPLLDESNIIELSSYEQAALAGAINQVTVTYRDCNTNKDVAITVQNPAAILAQGRIVTQAKQFPGLWNGDQATRVAMRDLRAASCLPARAKLKVQSDMQVQIGDVRAFSWARYKVVRMPMRVLEIDRGTPGDGALTLTLSQDVFSTPSQSYIVVQPPLWTAPDATPRAVVTQRLVEASYRDLAANLGAGDLAQVAATAGYVGALAARPTSTSISYALWSRTGSAAFAKHGVGDFAPLTVLANDMPCAAGPTTVAIGEGIDLGQVPAGSEVLIEQELCRLVAIDTANHTITVARGCADTVPDEHGGGASVWFTDTFTGVDRTEYITGETVDAKLLTVAGDGTLDINLAPTTSITLNQRQARPYPPGNLKINGVAYPPTVTADVVLTWSHRDRLLQADQLIDTTQGNIGPEPGVTYTVRTYLDDVLQSTVTGLTTTTCAPVISNTGAARVEIDAVRDGLASWQTTQWTGTVVVPITVAVNLPAGTVGNAYTSSVTAAGGLPGGYTYSVAAPGLPAGLSLNTTSGAITGTLTAAGYAVSQQPFGTGDGVTTSFPLSIGGVALAGAPTVTAVHRADWQGRQLLYPTARTQYIRQTEALSNAGYWGNSNVTATPSSTKIGGSGPVYWTIQRTAANGSALSQVGIPLPGAGNQSTARVWLRAGTTTQVEIGLHNAGGGSSVPCTATVISGPGAVRAGTAGFVKQIYGLSSQDTCVEVSRVSVSADSGNLGIYIYPNTTGGASGDSVLVGAPNAFSAAISSAYVAATTSAATITDYTISVSTVSFGAAPNNGATLDWDGAGTPKTIALTFNAADSGGSVGTGTGSLTSS